MGSWRDVFPQSVGLLPGKLSLLLVPYVEGWKEPLEDLLRLQFKDLPREWEFFSAVWEGSAERALELLERIGESEVREFNRWAITGTCNESFIKDPFLRALIEGSVPDILERRADLEAVRHLLLAREKASLNRGEAIKELDQAILKVQGISPVFQANLMLLKAKLLQEKGISYALLQLYMEIEKLVRDTGAQHIKGEANFQIGSIIQSFGNPQEAVRYFQKALDYYSREEEPYTWALIHNNLGLAYLSQPVTTDEDQIRLAMGIQHLKKALEVFTKDEYPQEWASTTLNYANALVYAPTGEPVKNLLRAVELYKEVLDFRRRNGPPESLARVLANLGNTLAHLGKLKEARDYLIEAKRLFLTLRMEQEAEAIEEILTQIEEADDVTSGA